MKVRKKVDLTWLGFKSGSSGWIAGDPNIQAMLVAVVLSDLGLLSKHIHIPLPHTSGND